MVKRIAACPGEEITVDGILYYIPDGSYFKWLFQRLRIPSLWHCALSSWLHRGRCVAAAHKGHQSPLCRFGRRCAHPALFLPQIPFVGRRGNHTHLRHHSHHRHLARYRGTGRLVGYGVGCAFGPDYRLHSAHQQRP